MQCDSRRSQWTALGKGATECGRFVFGRSGRRALRGFLGELARAGGYPAFVADLREGRGVKVPFFGRPAWSNPFPALIARVSGIPLYAAAVVRTKGAHFVVRIEPVEVPRGDDRDADVLATTAAIQARFEQFIRDTPEQWMWAHRRWD